MVIVCMDGSRSPNVLVVRRGSDGSLDGEEDGRVLLLVAVDTTPFVPRHLVLVHEMLLWPAHRLRISHILHSRGL